MNRITRVCLSLTALWVLGACGTTNTSKAQDVNTVEPKPDVIVIQGATLVEKIADERVIEAIRQELPVGLCSRSGIMTIDTVQVEEFEGRQYLTVSVNDEHGQCMNSSRDYTPDSMPGYAPKTNQ